MFCQQNYKRDLVLRLYIVLMTFHGSYMSAKDWISSALESHHAFFISCEPTQVSQHPVRGCLPFVTSVVSEMAEASYELSLSEKSCLMFTFFF